MSNKIEKIDQNIPSYLKEYEAVGEDDLSSDIMQGSYLQIAHENRDGINAGEWFDSVTKENYGDKVIVTPIKIKKVWRFFNSKERKLEKISNDGQYWDNGDKLTLDEKWRNLNIDIFVLINNNPDMPVIVSFKNTSSKSGKQFVTTISRNIKTRRESIFARNYTLFGVKHGEGSSAYYVMNFQMNPGFNDNEIAEISNKYRNLLLQNPGQAESEYPTDDLTSEGID